MTPLARGVISSGKIGGSTIAFYNTLSLNGSSQYVSCGNDASLRITGNITISCWINPTSIGVILAKASAAGPLQEAYRVGLQGDGKFEMVISPDGGYGSYVPAIEPTAADVGVWSHYAAVYNGSTIKIYRNASEVVSVAYSAGILDTSHSLTIGKMSGSSPVYYNGDISSAMVLNTDLSSGDITEIYNLGLPKRLNNYSTAITNNYALALPLNDGVIDPYVDRSVNGNDGTATGSPTFTGDALGFDLT